MGGNKISIGEYFIADVAFMPSNPVHRVIAVCDSEGTVPTFSLYSLGYESLRKHVNPFDSLHYFKLVEKISKMNEKASLFLAKEKTVSLDF